MGTRYLLYLTGWLVLALAVCMLPALLVGLAEPGFIHARAFGSAFGITSFFGVGLLFLGEKGQTDGLPRRRILLGLLVVAWMVLPLFAALPYLFDDLGLSLLEAYFEAASALTTTGATLLSGGDEPGGLGLSLLLWRGLLQWVGGFVTLLSVIVILPLLPLGGLRLFNNLLSHGEGGSLPARLRGAARPLLTVYLILTLGCAVLVAASGAPAFDAALIAMATVSTGGLTPFAGSIGAYNSVAMELVLIPFMLLAATNYTLHAAITRRGIRPYLQDLEVRPYLIFVGIALVIMVLDVIFQADLSGWQTLRRVVDGIFVAVSVATTTGFLPDAPEAFPLLGAMVVMPLLFIGGGTGSTAGGMKLMRVTILMQHLANEMRRLSFSHGMSKQQHGSRPLSAEIVGGIWAVFVAYIGALILLAMALGLAGLDLQAALSLATTSLTNAGPVLPFLVPETSDYSGYSDPVLVLLTLGMIAGRIEVLPVLALFTKLFWRR